MEVFKSNVNREGKQTKSSPHPQQYGNGSNISKANALKGQQQAAATEILQGRQKYEKKKTTNSASKKSSVQTLELAKGNYYSFHENLQQFEREPGVVGVNNSFSLPRPKLLLIDQHFDPNEHWCQDPKCPINLQQLIQNNLTSGPYHYHDKKEDKLVAVANEQTQGLWASNVAEMNSSSSKDTSTFLPVSVGRVSRLRQELLEKQSNTNSKSKNNEHKIQTMDRELTLNPGNLALLNRKNNNNSADFDAIMIPSPSSVISNASSVSTIKSDSGIVSNPSESNSGPGSRSHSRITHQSDHDSNLQEFLYSSPNHTNTTNTIYSQPMMDSSHSQYCPNCNEVLVNVNESRTPSSLGLTVGSNKTESGLPGTFWQHPIRYPVHRTNSVGGFTLNGHETRRIKHSRLSKFCSSHKVALVVSTFSLLVTIGLVITLILMKSKGMMEPM